MREVKYNLLRYRKKTLEENNNYNQYYFSANQIFRKVKKNISACFDGIYPEMLKNTRIKTNMTIL